jgi:hypothetical protein
LTGIGRLVGWLDRETIADGQTMTCGWMDGWLAGWMDIDTDIRITECNFVSKNSLINIIL